MLWHLTFAAAGRHPLFVDEADVRAAVRTLVHVAGPWLVLFSVVDDHVHAIVLCDRPAAGRLAQRLLLALRPLATVQLEPRSVLPVNGRNHMRALLGYLLTQPAHHGLSVHPLLWSGGCFVDLVGARAFGDFRLRIRDALPRFRLVDAWDAVGLPPADPAPATAPAIRAVGAHRLALATAAAACVSPSLAGKAPAVVEARAAVARLGTEVGFTRSELARALACTPQTVGRLVLRGAPLALESAIRRHLTLEGAFPTPQCLSHLPGSSELLRPPPPPLARDLHGRCAANPRVRRGEGASRR